METESAFGIATGYGLEFEFRQDEELCLILSSTASRPGLGPIQWVLATLSPGGGVKRAPTTN
jgi:hypothetical protein